MQHFTLPKKICCCCTIHFVTCCRAWHYCFLFFLLPCIVILGTGSFENYFFCPNLNSLLLVEKQSFMDFMVDIKAVFASFAGSGGPNCASARDAKSIKSQNENGCRADHPALAGATTTFASRAKPSVWGARQCQSQLQSHSYSANIGINSSWASGSKSSVWVQHWSNECYGSKTKSKY